MPAILMSICSEVTPRSVPATLESMSPRWSSSPRMSENGIALILEDEAHGDAGGRALERDAASISERRAHGGHGRGAVRLRDLGTTRMVYGTRD
jgi:hypothetical protein